MTTPETTNGLARGWWSNEPFGWSEMGDEVLARWQRTERAKVPIGGSDALIALAFGYGARLHYKGPEQDWSSLGQQLRLDWSAAGYALPWERARSAVKAGWTTAHGHREAPAHDVRDGRTDGPRLVPGGRMTGHGGKGS